MSRTKTVTSERPWTLLRSDDFSNPATGLFFNEQGTLIGRMKNGGILRYDAETRYAQRALVLGVKGSYATPYAGDSICHDALAADKVFDDVAVEVRGRWTSSAEQTSWGMWLGGYSYTVRPGGRYSLTQSSDVQVRSSSALHPGSSEENQLRIELVGDTLTGFANGRQIDRIQDSSLAARPLAIHLKACMTGQPASGVSEATFTDVKVFSRPAASPSGAATWSSLAADDFSNPANSLFPAQSGAVTGHSSQTNAQVSTQYRAGFGDGAFKLAASGPYYDVANAPTGPCVTTYATSQASRDFAVEVHGRATVSPERAGWGIRWSNMPRNVYGVELLPDRWYAMYRVLGGLNDSGMDLEYINRGRSMAIRPTGEDNQLRVEMTGKALNIYANGQRIEWTDWGLQGQPISVGLQTCMANPYKPLGSDLIPTTAPGASAPTIATTTAEVSFSRFHLYSLKA